MINKLFIYGTLAPGRPNEHVLKDLQGTWQHGSVTGILHQQGWGADMGYPGITLDETGERVEGYLFSSPDLKEKWTELDAFEGEEYERVQTEVELEDSSKVTAYIYSLKEQG